MVDDIDIQVADPGARRMLFGVSLVSIAVGLASLIAVQRVLVQARTLQASDPAAAVIRLITALRWLSWGLGATLVAGAAWLYRLARRIRSSVRFPPPGMAVVQDVRIRTGARALALGRVALAGAIALMVLGAVEVAMVERLIAMLT